MVQRNFGIEPCLLNFASFIHEETTLALIFQRMLYWSMFRLLEKSAIKNKYGSFATKVGEVVKS